MSFCFAADSASPGSEAVRKADSRRSKDSRSSSATESGWLERCGVAPTTVYLCLLREIINCFLPSFPEVSINSEDVEHCLHLPQTVDALEKTFIYMRLLLDNLLSDHKISAWSSKVFV